MICHLQYINRGNGVGVTIRSFVSEGVMVLQSRENFNGIEVGNDTVYAPGYT